METPELILDITETTDFGYHQIETWGKDIRLWRQYGDGYGDYTTQRLIEDLTNAVVYLSRRARQLELRDRRETTP